MPSNSMRSTTKRTRTSSDITACPPLQPAQSCIRFIAPGPPPMPLNCASQSSCFLCVNGAEHAVKLHGKCDEAHTDLTRHRGMSPVTTSAELYHVYRTWESPRRCTSQRCKRLGRRIKFRGHAKLCRAMVSNGAWYRELLLSFAYSFGTVR